MRIEILLSSAAVCVPSIGFSNLIESTNKCARDASYDRGVIFINTYSLWNLVPQIANQNFSELIVSRRFGGAIDGVMTVKGNNKKV